MEPPAASRMSLCSVKARIKERFVGARARLCMRDVVSSRLVIGTERNGGKCWC